MKVCKLRGHSYDASKPKCPMCRWMREHLVRGKSDAKYRDAHREQIATMQRGSDQLERRREQHRAAQARYRQKHSEDYAARSRAHHRKRVAEWGSKRMAFWANQAKESV